jgi:hypothetical protein
MNCNNTFLLHFTKFEGIAHYTSGLAPLYTITLRRHTSPMKGRENGCK